MKEYKDQERVSGKGQGRTCAPSRANPALTTDDRHGRQPEGLGQLCAPAFLGALSQHCKSAVDLRKQTGSLAQGMKPSTPLLLFLIFGSQRGRSSARQEARLWETPS